MRVFGEDWLMAGVVKWLKIQASKGVADMRSQRNHMMSPYLANCLAYHRPTGTKLMLGRDTGHHTCGWWKNPDYERCVHLSLSFLDPKTGQHRDKDIELSREWVDLVFGEWTRLVWAEPPFSPEGRLCDTWHYRVFYADAAFTAPILPRGEVYSKEFTEAGWLSYSDLQDKLRREARERMERA